MTESTVADARIARRVLLQGQVQGIGYRPALARLANELRLSGWVRNTDSGVEVHIEGPRHQVEQFIEHCDNCCPSLGKIRSKQVSDIAREGTTAFQIDTRSHAESLSTSVPIDYVVCRECMQEVLDPRNRRFGYLLTSCSQCGPRYSILESMPYERENTTMHTFSLCEACRSEYENPANRRFHAQTTCCSQCGPTLRDEAKALACLRDGKILCLKGIGGYQLLTNALNPLAVERLRAKKGREAKPLAIMVPSLEIAEAIGDISVLEGKLLQSEFGPIVVVHSREGAVPMSISRGLSTIGLMLPTTPLHAWLTCEIGPLVVTSGNMEGDPIAFDNEASCESLMKIADDCVDHNRRIRRPIDDSVTRVIAGKVSMIRLARGLAPLPIRAIDPAKIAVHPHILAVGGQQKVAVALSNGSQNVLGPHIGDMDSLASRQRFIEHVDNMLGLYKARPSIVVHDLHEDYFTTRWAVNYAEQTSARRIAVQHHHAHVVAGMVDAGWLTQRVLGVAWDGTGMGTDGTIWGGEFLIATSTGFQRSACLRPFLIPGGEAAIREPWRLAASLLRDVRTWDPSVTYRIELESKIAATLDRGVNSPITTSAGRLFDAVAALVLPDHELRRGRAAYEGHFAALLESHCDTNERGKYLISIDEPSFVDFPKKKLAVPRTIDWRPMIRGILEDLQRNVPPSTIAMRFHRTMAHAIGMICDLASSLPVVLGGGVFQNKILVDLIAEDFGDENRPIALPGVIPVNDGGLAAGQLAIALAILEEEQQCA